MSHLREMQRPVWEVEREGEMVRLALLVPRSKFGWVHAYFKLEDAVALANVILCLEQGADPGVR